MQPGLAATGPGLEGIANDVGPVGSSVWNGAALGNTASDGERLTGLPRENAAELPVPQNFAWNAMTERRVALTDRKLIDIAQYEPMICVEVAETPLRAHISAILLSTSCE